MRIPGWLAFSFALAHFASVPSAERADLVLVNGNVVAMDADNRVAEAVAVRSDRISAVGASEVIRETVGEATVVVDLAEKSVVPGMIDARVHFVKRGNRLLELDAPHVRDEGEIIYESE